MFSIQRLLLPLSSKTPKRKTKKKVRFNLNPTTTGASRDAILDTGATGHFSPQSYKGKNEQATTGGILVKSATNQYIKAIATDELNIPTLSTPATVCHKFKDTELADPLISIPQLTKHGCNAQFTPHGAIITNTQGNTVLRGQFNHHKNAYTVDLDQQNIIQPADTSTQVYNTKEKWYSSFYF